MDDLVNDLLQELKSLREDMGSARAEATERHLIVTREFGTLAERFMQLNERLDRLENRPGKGSGVRAAVTGVADLARIAILG
jgi:hypothetical protein